VTFPHTVHARMAADYLHGATLSGCPPTSTTSKPSRIAPMTMLSISRSTLPAGRPRSPLFDRSNRRHKVVAAADGAIVLSLRT
jgi:hypothetical protein